MKTIIYTIVFGLPEHYLLAQEWVNSIRASGCAAKIIIVSDKAFEVQGAEVMVASFMTPSQLWKAAIYKLVDCSRYDKILYMDTDIVSIKNVNAFFELDGIQVAREPLKIKESGLNPVFLKPEEIEKCGNEKSWNAGTFIMPGNRAEMFLMEWENEWKKINYKGQKDYWPDTKIYKGQMYDQGILQAMICRNLFTKMPLAMPENFVGFPCLADPKDEVVLHLCGLKHTESNKKHLLDLMISLRDKSKVKEICKGLKEMANPIKVLNEKLDLCLKLIMNQDKEIVSLFAKVRNLEADLELSKQSYSI